MARVAMQRTLERVFDRSRRHGTPLAVVIFSIDRFRLINTRFGYREADRILARVARIARDVLPSQAASGRWNGDEFLCLLPGLTGRTLYEPLEALRARLEAVVLPVGDSVINITASFGVATYPEDGHDLRYLLVGADEALHEAKCRGRNQIVEAATLENHVFRTGTLLETALREERVIPAYQPIVDLRNGRVVAEEVLARIVMPDGSMLAADQFMDVASEFQLTHKIDRMIVLSTFRRCVSERDEAPRTRFINISGDVFHHPALLKELVTEFKRNLDLTRGRPQAPLVLEITEREVLTNLEAVRRTLAPFIDLGLKIALDDFGSGYSSFQYLADLPVSYLKIDGGLIRRIDEPKVRGIVSGIQAVASQLHLTTLAEYVETAEQVQWLRQVGIDWAQGHYYGRASVNASEADLRRSLSVNWAEGYYCKVHPGH